VLFWTVLFVVLFHPPPASVELLPLPVPVTKGTRTIVGELWPEVVEFANSPAPVSATDASKLPAVGYSPPVPGGSWTESEVAAAFCTDAPVPKGATGTECVDVSDDVELPARNTGGNIVPAIGGAVPKGRESGDEVNAG